MAKRAFFPLLIGDSFSVSPFIIGLVMSVSSIATGLTSSQLGRIARLSSERGLIGVACVLYAVALVSIPFAPSLWLLLIPTIIFGVAMGISLPSLMALLADLAPMQQRGAVMSLNGMVLRLGQTLGPLIMGAVIVVWGLGGVFYVGAGFAIVMLAVVVLMIE